MKFWKVVERVAKKVIHVVNAPIRYPAKAISHLVPKGEARTKTRRALEIAGTVACNLAGIGGYVPK